MPPAIKYPDIQTLRNLSDAEKWTELESILLEFAEDSSCPSWIHFFLGQAQKNLGKYQVAVHSIERGLAKSPANSWAHIMLFESVRMLGRKQEAYDRLLAHIEGGGEEVESARTVFVVNAAIDGIFAAAVKVNEARAVIRKLKLPQPPKYAVAVQCFNKSDTLERVLEALMECRGTDEFGLVILQDSARFSKKENIFAKEAEKVSQVLGSWLPRMIEKFPSVELMKNDQNLGTAPSLRRLLDKVCARYEGFVFLEDDCVLSSDALEWTHELLEKHISPYDLWFGTCESIFFDSKSEVRPAGALSALRRFSESEAILNSYVLLDFLPSTCFITRKEIWSVCSEIRSFVEGPESLTAFLSSMNRKTIAPVVPRASDIGMLHQFGYSVSNLGLGQVKEIKNTYLMSSAQKKVDSLQLYSGNLDLLFSASVRLNQSSADYLSSMYAEKSSSGEYT